MKPILLISPLLALGIGAFFLLQDEPASLENLAPPPVTQSVLPTDETTAIGPVAGPVEGMVRPKRLSLHPDLVENKLKGEYNHAPDWVREAARALMNGNDMPAIQSVDDVAKPFMPPTPTLEQPSTLVRTALEFDRMDAISAMLNAGMNPNVDDNIILWKTLEQWTPGTADNHTKALEAYIAAGGDVDIAHDEGFSAIELAATVSSDVVLILMKNGASPWTHPDGLGSGLTERLSLHINVPFVLDMLEHIATSSHAAPADTRALENTIGNLVDHYDALVEKGAAIGVKNGEATGTIDPTVQQIAEVVMAFSVLENTPWAYIPQEFVDMRDAGLLTGQDSDLN